MTRPETPDDQENAEPGGHEGMAGSEFLRHLRHELRNPLNVIIGLSDALQEGAYGPLTPLQAKSLGAIEESGERLVRQIDALVEFLRIQADTVRPKQRDLDLARCCQDAAAHIRTRAMKKKQAITVTVDDAPSTLYADPDMLQKILDHVLAEAMQRAEEGGEIEIRAVISSEHQDRVAISVRYADTVGHEGHGIGLALARNLVQIHGGNMEIANDHGQETRFTVLLPTDPDRS